jgi:hypothetical protein
MSSSRPHRCDEFPAEYSLASCSPAELASASSASLMLQPTTPFVEQISANGNRGTFPLSQLKGSPQAPIAFQGVLELTTMSSNSFNVAFQGFPSL